MAHLDSTLRRLHSYFQYLGLDKFAHAISARQKLQELNLDHFRLMDPWQEIPIPWQPKTELALHIQHLAP